MEPGLPIASGSITSCLPCGHEVIARARQIWGITLMSDMEVGQVAAKQEQLAGVSEKDASTLVYIARHGQTESNLRRRYAGSGSEELTAEGRRETAILARDLGPAGLSTVWTSRIARARQTASLLSIALDIPTREEGRLDEMQLGPWEGLTEDEIAVRHRLEFETWNERPDLLRVDGRETLSQLTTRVWPVLVSASTSRQPVLLVTHVAIIRVLTLAVLGFDLAAYKRVPVPNASCMRVDLAAGEIVRYPSLRRIREELDRASNSVGVEP